VQNFLQPDADLTVEGHVPKGSIASSWPCASQFRSTPINRHSQTQSACLKGAKSGSRSALFNNLVARRSKVSSAIDGSLLHRPADHTGPPLVPLKMRAFLDFAGPRLKASLAEIANI
jgi:hypothetical protein